MSRSRNAVPLLVLLLVVLLQVSVVQRIDIAGASPDLVVLVIITLALLTDSVRGAMYGFAGGLALALFVALPLGPHALVGTLIGYWVGRWGEVLVTDEHPAPPIIAGVLGTLVLQIGRPLVEFLVNPAVTTTSGIWSQALIVTALNAVLVTPIYMLTRRLVRRSIAVGAQRPAEAA